MKRTFLVLLLGLFLFGCTAKDVQNLRRDNLKLKDENLALRQENIILKEQVLEASATMQELETKYELLALKGNLGALRSTLTVYYGVHSGEWPPSLEELVPEYLSEIPKGDWNYNPETGRVISKSHPSW